MPVDKLFGVGSRTTEKLGKLGVTTIGELARVPREVLRKLFGVYGLYLHEVSNGRDPTPVVPEADTPPAKSVGNSYTLLQDSNDVDHLLRILLGLSSKVGRRLRGNGQRGRTVTVTIRLFDFTTITRARTLPIHIDRDKLIYETARRILLRQRDRHEKYRVPVRLLGVSVSGLDTEEGGAQLGLLDRRYWRKYDGMLAAADKIRDRYGERALTWARLVRCGESPRLLSHKMAGLSWERRQEPAQ
ncbi:MAG: hypothetical protein R6V58_13680 [Planctomycetota bacterium]